MQRLPVGEIARAAAAAGFTGKDLVTAVAIALAESSGNPLAVGDNGDSIGLWQIDTRYHPEYKREDLFDAFENARAAYEIYVAAGKSFKPWSTYKNGAYLAYVRDAQRGVSA